MALDEFAINVIGHLDEYGFNSRNSGLSYLGFYITPYLVQIVDSSVLTDAVYRDKYLIILETISSTETIDGRKICVVGMTVSFEDIINGVINLEDVIIGNITFEGG